MEYIRYEAMLIFITATLFFVVVRVFMDNSIVSASTYYEKGQQKYVLTKV